jgi:hypothetical protein
VERHPITTMMLVVALGLVSSPLKKGTSTFSGLIFTLLLKPEKENVPFFNGMSPFSMGC